MLISDSSGKEVIAMNDAEVALGLLKLLLEKCPEACGAAQQKESFLQLYRDCLAAVRDEEA